ncbi:MAG TPA: cation-transporting P-type ATPase, partial [Acidimicrobiales bacterium]
MERVTPAPAAERDVDVARFWGAQPDDLLRALDTSRAGLATREAARRRARDGPNTIGPAHGHRGARLLLAQFTSPIILILAAATVVSIALGDITDGAIILAIIVA